MKRIVISSADRDGLELWQAVGPLVDQLPKERTRLASTGSPIAIAMETSSSMCWRPTG